MNLKEALSKLESGKKRVRKGGAAHCFGAVEKIDLIYGL
jgi:hypothetical protein